MVRFVQMGSGRTRIVAVVMLAVLSGCTQDVVVAPLPAEVFRDTSAQIASQTDVTPDRMAGRWIVRQRFSGQSAMGDELTLSVLPAGDLQLSVPIRVCVDGTCVQNSETLVLLRSIGPGRWTPVDAPAGLPDDEIWVMWMDFDSRTAAIGTPSGEFGWIMDKNPTGGQDRITAARDIMDWFGYNIDQLREVSP